MSPGRGVILCTVAIILLYRSTVVNLIRIHTTHTGRPSHASAECKMIRLGLAGCLLALSGRRPVATLQPSPSTHKSKACTDSPQKHAPASSTLQSPDAPCTATGAPSAADLRGQHPPLCAPPPAHFSITLLLFVASHGFDANILLHIQLPIVRRYLELAIRSHKQESTLYSFGQVARMLDDPP